LFIGLAFGQSFPLDGLDADLIATGYEVRLNLDNQTVPATVMNSSYIDLTGLLIPSGSFTFESRLTWIGQNLANQTQTIFFYGTSNNYVWIGGLPQSSLNNAFGNIFVVVKNSTGVFLSPAVVKSSGLISWCFISAAFSSTSYSVTVYTWNAGLTMVTSTQAGSNMIFNPADVGTSGVSCYYGWAPAAPAAEIQSKLASQSTTGFSYLAARVDEIRIFNSYRDFTTSRPDSVAHVGAYEPGIYALWIIQETSGTIITDSVSSRIATVINGGVIAQNDYKLIVNRQEIVLLYNTTFSMPVQSLNAAATSVTQTSVNEVTACYDKVGTCYPFPVDASTFSVAAPYPIVITPKRTSCDTTQVVSFQSTSDPFVLTIDYVPYNLSVNEAVVNVPSTSASVVRLTGSVGTGYADGAIDGTVEYVRFQGDSNSTLTTLTSFVNSSGLFVSFPAGYAVGQLYIKLCGQSLTRPVQYPQPNITRIKAYSASNFTLEGTGFGNSRTWASNAVVFTTLNANNTQAVINCGVTNNNDIAINCLLDQNAAIIQGKPLNISAQIGSIVTTYYSPAFDPCDGLCQNGGKCLGYDNCDCYSTLYNGTYCTEKLSCTPPCNEDHGNCTRDYNSTIANPPNICVCTDAYTGNTCNSKISNGKSTPVALIAGVVTAAGVVMLALVAIVVVLLIKNKNQRRGGKNFIPLHKKDFTKIIYGEQLNQDAEKSDADLSRLEQMLVEDNLEVAVAVSNMTQITEADKIAKALVVIFQDHDKVLTLLQAFIAEEVNTTESAGTLFRSNSMVSKMFKFYSRLIGLPYLYETIGPELCELIEEELGLEVDPEKMEEGTDLDEMRWMLMAQSQKILKSILNNIERCPPQFRVLFAHIKKCVAERFPENVNTTIGGFIFLRFFCPAVSSPEAYGIVEEPPSASARRLLILITKVLQNLSNDVEFGSKEPYMTKMNDFIHSNRQKLGEFYDKLIKPATKANVTCVLPKNIKAVSLSVIANHIKENVNKVENPSVKSRLESVFSS
jgi:hypothetical protein